MTQRSRPPFLLLVALPLTSVAVLSGCNKSPTTATASTPPPPTSAPAQIDPASRLAAARAELARAEDALTKRYLELDKRRARLAKASPAEVEAFNKEAAAYTADVAALRKRAEIIQQQQQSAAPANALPPAEAQAQACLARLRAAINVNDWPAQLSAMELALAQYRNTETFRQISEIVLPRLSNVTTADLEKSLRAVPVATAVSSNSATSPNAAALVQELRAIINQPVKPVPTNGNAARVVNFHPGGSPLDFGRVSRDGLLRDRMLFPYPQVEPAAHRGTFYRGEDIEFNLQLKYYYADPTLPTKRLSDAEYDRVVAICGLLAQAPKSDAAPTTTTPGNSQAIAALWARVEKLRQTWPH